MRVCVHGLDVAVARSSGRHTTVRTKGHNMMRCAPTRRSMLCCAPTRRKKMCCASSAAHHFQDADAFEAREHRERLVLPVCADLKTEQVTQRMTTRKRRHAIHNTRRQHAVRMPHARGTPTMLKADARQPMCNHNLWAGTAGPGRPTRKQTHKINRAPKGQGNSGSSNE